MPTRSAHIAAALLACACAANAHAQQPGASTPMFQITDARNEAVGFAITHSLVVERLLKACAAFKDALPRDMDRVLQNWTERNWERLEAAHGYLFYVREMTSGRAGSDEAEAWYRKTLDGIEQRATDALADVFTQRGPTAASCAKWSTTIAQTRADLDWRPQYVQLLDEIVAFHRSVLGKPGKR